MSKFANINYVLSKINGIGIAYNKLNLKDIVCVEFTYFVIDGCKNAHL